MIKPPLNMEPILRFAKSLGFGATTGACLGLILRHYLPQLPLADREAMYGGAAIGALLHRVLDWIMNGIMRPVSSFTGYYFKLLQLRLLGTVVTPEQREKIMERLTKDHFLGK